ncbi:MAG: bifunctional [glutamate--ammonia ligase]-adenylyl-L-tyrosine phosphorylase/[glutamate--ammonia-ligase] adenylyltransferase [Planctomycetales bacterium]|nr:bifunctional [glutamate--ammonia ligase]-adenylyl-L-tyrosine phosphorylase/[glutamate--ammonia-ligase] adenylyltransferase [Planctomycetales bacterium]
MDLQQLSLYLADAGKAEPWLRAMGLEETKRGHANLAGMSAAGLTLDLMATVSGQLSEYLPATSHPDMALNNLARFIDASRNPLGLGALFERDPEALKILLRIFSNSQHLSDLLIRDPESYDLLRITEGQPVARDTLCEEIWSEASAWDDDRACAAALRRFKQRETLRIAYGDLIRDQRLETVTQQISFLAEAITDAALRFSLRKAADSRGIPRGPDGQPARLVALGMGKLGGHELNYSSDIDLIFVYDLDGETDGRRPQQNSEHFAAVIRDTVKLLSESTPLGVAYRVDLRLRPNGGQGPLAISMERALQYYDVLGRTWERQAFVKARPVAGDLDFGRLFLRNLQAWVYRTYLARADITGIKALKRRIEQRSRGAGEEMTDVKTGHGGIRDIEFAIQFLQLLNGGDLQNVRHVNTLEAIDRLAKAGCLSDQERSLLSEHYRFLRKLEHRLQIMFDLQTHQLPDDPKEVGRLAIRMGYAADSLPPPRQAFQADYQRITKLNRKVLDHLLHDAFRDDAPAAPEVDLVLAPEPTTEQIEQVLGAYGFVDVAQAYRNLMELSQEKIRFLSTRRCRHFLAAIAPALLKAIARRPDPDSTLIQLCKVSDSLGGKGVLWELFSFNPPTLELYVDLCATSPYLSGILISNPGMIDELMDSLVLDKLPTLAELEATLQDLCHAAEDTDPILHSFRNAQNLRVGVRDILGKETIEATTAALADTAEACLRQITRGQYAKLVDRLGEPVITDGPRAGQVCELIILAMGKFGGRELNYQSDLDIIFLYEAEGSTQQRRPTRRSVEKTSNRHFFGELGRRIINVASRMGPYGRLYEIDPRLRPTGRSGPLATSLSELGRYFAEGDGQLWERMALCRARVVVGNRAASQAADQAVAQAAFGRDWRPADAVEVLDMRRRLEETAGQGNIKRGVGGLVDIEFITQMLQLRYAAQLPEIRQPNTLAALAALNAAGRLEEDHFQFLTQSYRWLRRIETRLQLMGSSARDAIAEEAGEQNKLAQALGYPDGESLLAECQQLTRQNRLLFEQLFAEAGG